MNAISIHEAKTHLSRFVDAALAGEDVVITRRRKPVVRLTVVRESNANIRQAGSLPGLIARMDDSFNDEFILSDESPFPQSRRSTQRKKSRAG